MAVPPVNASRNRSSHNGRRGRTLGGTTRRSQSWWRRRRSGSRARAPDGGRRAAAQCATDCASADSGIGAASAEAGRRSEVKPELISDGGNMLARLLALLVSDVAADRPAAHVRPQLRTNFASHPNLVAAKPTPSARFSAAGCGMLSRPAARSRSSRRPAEATKIGGDHGGGGHRRARADGLRRLARPGAPRGGRLLVATGVITLKEALNGFKSEGVVSVGMMYAVAKGVQCTGGLELIAKLLSGGRRGTARRCGCSCRRS